MGGWNGTSNSIWPGCCTRLFACGGSGKGQLIYFYCDGWGQLINLPLEAEKGNSPSTVLKNSCFTKEPGLFENLWKRVY